MRIATLIATLAFLAGAVRAGEELDAYLDLSGSRLFDGTSVAYRNEIASLAADVSAGHAYSYAAYTVKYTSKDTVDSYEVWLDTDQGMEASRNASAALRAINGLLNEIENKDESSVMKASLDVLKEEKEFATKRVAQGDTLINALYNDFVVSHSGETVSLDMSPWKSTFGSGWKASSNLDSNYLALVDNYRRDKEQEANSDPNGDENGAKNGDDGLAPGTRGELIGPERSSTYLVVMGSLILVGLASVGGYAYWKKGRARTQVSGDGFAEELRIMNSDGVDDDEEIVI